MQDRITNESLFHQWQTPALLLLFFVLRIGSFLLAPYAVAQGIIVFFFLLFFAGLYFSHQRAAWYLLIIELVLGGSGHFLELGEISIRTALIGTFLLIWTLQQISDGNLHLHLSFHRPTQILLTLLGIAVVSSAALGLAHGHGLVPVIQDLIPFTLLALLPPVRQAFQDKAILDFFTRTIIVSIIGTALFVTLLYFLYSSGLLEIHEPFYKWFRDVNAGKITDMGTGFFRIVEPGHLLVVPMTLFIASLLMKEERHHTMWRVLLTLCMLILVVNLSRIYALALCVGLCVLLLRHSLYRWLRVSLSLGAIGIVLYLSLSLLGSGGQSLGLELFGIRIASVAQPAIEESSATRMAILPAILEQIYRHPLFGGGLGNSVTFFYQPTFETITTRQYDWGYFELLAELGLVGTTLFLGLIWSIGSGLLRHIKSLTDYQDYHVGLFAGLISLCIITLTTPVLFHVYGVLFLVLLLTVIHQPIRFFDEMVTRLYRVFHRK